MTNSPLTDTPDGTANGNRDAAILKAMRSNEEDTVTAYERASGHTEVNAEARAFFTKVYVTLFTAKIYCTSLSVELTERGSFI